MSPKSLLSAAQRLNQPEPRQFCTDCGVSRSSNPKACGQACQFLSPDYDKMDLKSHGRTRDPDRSDEAHFGVVQAMHRARLSSPKTGAQWTGITTRLGERLLETGLVDGVLTVVPDPEDRWKPVPVVITDPKDMSQARGMRMGFAPTLALIEQAVKSGCRRLALISIPCQTYAVRALQSELDLEALYVIGTPCSDNTTTENFHQFLQLLSDTPEQISYLEFRADYHVEIRFDSGRVQKIPFLELPISKLPADFFPMTCRTCVDYTNTLSDITIGYMGGEGDQWLIVRNDTGARLLELLKDEVELHEPKSRGNRRSAVKGFQLNTERAAGGLPIRSMPNWVRPIVARLMPIIGPKGLEFARARVEMKAIESILYLRAKAPRHVRAVVPAHIWGLAEKYGLRPVESEMTKSMKDAVEPTQHQPQ